MKPIIPEQIIKHPFEYLALFFVLILSLIAYFYFAYDTHVQRRIVYMAASAYFLWSLYHHYRRGDLHISIIIEYLLMAILGVIFLTSTLI